MFKGATDVFSTLRHDHVPNASQRSEPHSGTWVQISARSTITRIMDSTQQGRKVRQKQSSGS